MLSRAHHKGDWITGGSGRLAAECRRCGEKLNLPLPMNLKVWLAATKAFCKVHMRCKEENAE